MNKPEAMQRIIAMWEEVPKADQRTLYFKNTFYPNLEKNHPELLQWRLVGGFRDKEVQGILMQKNLMEIG